MDCATCVAKLVCVTGTVSWATTSLPMITTGAVAIVAVTDSVCDGAVDSDVAGAVVGAVVPLLDVVVVAAVEVAGGVIAWELLGTTLAVTGGPVGGVVVLATGKNSHIAS